MHGSILKQLNNGKPSQAKPNVCVISDGEAGAYCTVRLVYVIWDARILFITNTQELRYRANIFIFHISHPLHVALYIMFPRWVKGATSKALPSQT